MAGAFVATGGVQTGTTSVTITGVTASVDDWLYLYCFHKDPTSIPATPSGWTQVGHAQSTSGHLALFRKKVTSGGAQSNVTISGLTSSSSGSMAAFSGLDTTEPNYTTDVSGSPTKTQSNAEGTTGLGIGLAGKFNADPGAVVVVIQGYDNDGSTSAWSIEGSSVGVNEIADGSTTGGTDNASAWAYVLDSVGTGWSQFGDTFTEGGAGTADNVAMMVALIPASGAQNVTPTGISSAGALGSPTITTGSVTVSPTGISTAEALGSPTVAVVTTVSPTGISSAEALGSPTATPGSVTASPTGIATAGALGSPSITVTVPVSGISSAEALGSPTVTSTITVSPTGVATAGALGSVTITTGSVTVQPGGIATSGALGDPVVSVAGGPQNVAPTGISSAESLGSPTVTPGSVTVSPAGIGAPVITVNILENANFEFETNDAGWTTFGDESIDQDTTTSAVGSGSLRVTKGSFTFPTVHSQNGVHGDIPLDPTYRVSLWMKGSSAVEAFFTVHTDFESSSENFNITTGWQKFTFGPYTYSGLVFTQFDAGPNVATPSGFQYWLDDIRIEEDRPALGTPTVTVGTSTVSPTGISGAGALGTPTVSVVTTVSPTGISSAGTVGTPTVTPGAVTVSPSGIATAEQLGAPTISGAVPAAQTVQLGNTTATDVVGSITVLAGGLVQLEGMARTDVVGIPTLRRQVFVLTIPTVEELGPRPFRTAIDKVGTPQGVTVYRSGGVWRAGYNLGTDKLSDADRVYRGGYDNLVEDPAERAELAAAGYLFETRTV